MLLYRTNVSSREFFITYRRHLSLYYVFYYLYNNKETIEQRLYYNEIRDFYKDKHTLDSITNTYNIAMFNRLLLETCNKTPIPKNCNRNCHKCERINSLFLIDKIEIIY